jgi:membrane-associated phospholipid phosphatase
MLKITRTKLIYYLTLLCSLLAGYFAFTDLQISISVVDTSVGWAKFLEKFGEIPGLLVLYSGTLISLLHYLSGNHKLKYLFLPILLLVATFLSSYFTAKVYLGLTGNYSISQDNTFYLGGVLLILNLFAAYRLRNFTFEERVLKYAGKTMLLGLFGYLLLIQPLKHFWGRVRFRELDLLYNNFTPWFLPNGFTGHESFPSGHSAMAWMVLPLLILVSDRGKVIRNAVLLIIIIWGLVVPVSRVVLGAHYASDALFGACIIILSYLIINSKYQFALISESKYLLKL